MADWYGWMGTILRVDLSTGKITKEPLSKELASNYIGGRGINSKILYDETGPETDPLGPDNRLIVGTGPTSGTLGLGNGRPHLMSCSNTLASQGKRLSHQARKQECSSGERDLGSKVWDQVTSVSLQRQRKREDGDNVVVANGHWQKGRLVDGWSGGGS